MMTKWSFRFIVLAYVFLGVVWLAVTGALLYLLYWLIFVGIPLWMS